MNIKTDFPRPIREIENTFIEMNDGTRLAARIWLPIDAEQKPVPAILEYLPYRKNDLTARRDANRMPYFAGHGYAAVRVDMRGSGDSDGILNDEYLKQEQDDALQVIEWLSKQEWCTGAVGMMGISWGGFNSLQVAARRPPELKAIIALAFTVDRYAEDVHYMGGCVVSEMLPWASTMLALNALPPDPRSVGEQWREIWFARMQESPPFSEAWLAHQRRDAYWKHGSVCEDYSAIQCPVMAVAGAADAYTNSLFQLLEGLSVPRIGIYGPWAHIYPHHAMPAPAIGFLQEALRWWDKWLKGIETGIEREPMLRAWMHDYVTPATYYAGRPGHWIAEESYPSPNIRPRVFYLHREEMLGDSVEGSNASAVIVGKQSAGLTTGVWGNYGHPGTYADDQALEDHKSLTFTSAPFTQPFETLGIPEIRLRVSADRPNALVSVRLCDVAPDGASLLVSWGLLNLTHRSSDEFPEPLEPGQDYKVSVVLKPLSHSFASGHRLRVAISPTNFPHGFPSPIPVTLRVHFAGSDLTLPVRAPGSLDASVHFEQPEGSAPLAVEWLREPGDDVKLEHDLVTHRYTLARKGDGGRFRILSNGEEFEELESDIFSIVEGEPLSATIRCERIEKIVRGDWDIRIETDSELTCDVTTFYLSNNLRAFENDNSVFAKTWQKAIPRDHL